MAQDRNSSNQFYDSTDDYNEGRRRNYRDNDWSDDDSNYGSSNANYSNRGGNEDMRNASYGSIYGGNVERREEETNRAKGGRYNRHQNENDYNRRYSNMGGGYSNSSEYDRYIDDNSQWKNRGGNYGASNYNKGNYEGNNRDENRNPGWGNRGYGNMSNRREDRDWWDKTSDEVSSWFGNDDAERRRENDKRMGGAHKGKGPKGYKRSDERIKEDICDRLSDDDYIDASDIDINVEGSEVVLTGTVSNRMEKRRAEDLVEAISGVKHVENRIRVKDSSRFGDNDNRNDRRSDKNEPSYTNPNEIGSQSGTTNEIIRNTGNMNMNEKL